MIVPLKNALNAVCLLLAVIGSTAGSLVFAGSVRVFGTDGTHVTVDSKRGTVLQTGSIWNTEGVPEKGKNELAKLARYAIHRVVADESNDRLFLLLGHSRGERYLGYLVLRLSDLAFVHVLEQEMVRALTWLMPNKPLGKLYLGYLDLTGKSITKAYDAHTYRELHEYKDSAFTLQGASCFLGDGTTMYTNRRVFDLKADKELREAGLRLLPISCSAGHVLHISSTPDKKTKLVLYDPESGKIIAEMATEVGFRYRSAPWLLYDDGRIVIHNEEQLVPVGAGRAVEKTGTLEIYDLLAGKKTARIKLKIETREEVMYGRIVGSLGKERKLLYAAQKRLLQIDLDQGIQEWEIVLPFAPIGIASFGGR